MHLPRAVAGDAARLASSACEPASSAWHPARRQPARCAHLSAGLAMLDPRNARSASDVLKEADEALYRAKQLGRNRVELPISEAPRAA